MKIILFILKLVFHKRITKYHILAFLKNKSFKKFKNFLLNEFERMTKKNIIKSMPYLLDLEATNKFNRIVKSF